MELLYKILIGGAIFIVVAIGALGLIAGLFNDLFGAPPYAATAKDIGATKTASDQYEVMIDGERIAFGENSSSYRVKSVATYFFVATAFKGAGYVGIYDRRYDMYGAKCHPGACELRSGDAEFDSKFFIHGDGAGFAEALLASASKRESITRLRNAGYTEILFNDADSYPRREQYISARMPRNALDPPFDPDQVTPALIRRTAKLLQGLTTT